MGVSAVAGAVVGGVMQGRAAKKAAKANIAQQQASLEFQEKQIQRGLKDLGAAFRFGREGVLAETERQRRDIEAGLEARGIDPASTMGLGARRAASADAAKAISDLYANIGQMRAGMYTGQQFPMIMQQGPQGNWAADAARLATMMGSSPGFSSSQLAMGGAGATAAGQALSGAGLGMFGAPLQMAGQGMTSAATSE